MRDTFYNLDGNEVDREDREQLLRISILIMQLVLILLVIALYWLNILHEGPNASRELLLVAIPFLLTAAVISERNDNVLLSFLEGLLPKKKIPVWRVMLSGMGLCIPTIIIATVLFVFLIIAAIVTTLATIKNYKSFNGKQFVARLKRFFLNIPKGLLRKV